MRQGHMLYTLLSLLLFISPYATAQVSPSAGESLPGRLLVGYWHNWPGSPNSILLREVSDAYDIINVAFAVPSTPGGATMQFVPESSLYPTPEDFIADISILKSRGKKILIAVGGASDSICVRTPTGGQEFASSMKTIIDRYGFDGMDIDLEGRSLVLDSGDRDFRHPTSPLIVNFVDAVIALTDQFPPTFILTTAPETATMQGGYATYAGIWGAYLPVVYALRDRLTFIHVQHYNTGTMFGRDGRVYEPGTADFHVAMVDMLLAGFPVDVHGTNIAFPPLAPAQVLMGLPASPSAAGSGYTPPSIVHEALEYLVLGRSFGGQSQINSPNGYHDFRGLMTWSINWDVQNGNEFSVAHRGFLDTLSLLTLAQDEGRPLPEAITLEQNYPNPFNPVTTIQYALPVRTHVRLTLIDPLGQTVRELVDGEIDAGNHSLQVEATGLASGVYFYRLRAGDRVETKRLVLVR